MAFAYLEKPHCSQRIYSAISSLDSQDDSHSKACLLCSQELVISVYGCNEVLPHLLKTMKQGATLPEPAPPLQFDIHQPFTTVHEALKFSALLRFSSDTPNDTVQQFVLEVMKLVELDSLSNALVGRPGISGLSVEQRKRLTIAVELVANPSIVFMDEPTSGALLPLMSHGASQESNKACTVSAAEL